MEFAEVSNEICTPEELSRIIGSDGNDDWQFTILGKQRSIALGTLLKAEVPRFNPESFGGEAH